MLNRKSIQCLLAAVALLCARTGVYAQPCAATVTQPFSISLCAGGTVPAIPFTGTADSYSWTSSIGSIGLGGAGSGNIASFTALNSGTIPVVSTVTVTPNGTLPATPVAYVPNKGHDNVSVINLTTGTVTGTITVGDEPIGVAIHAGTGRVYITNQASNNVSVIDMASASVIATINVGAEPQGVVVSADGSRVYVANRTGQSISVIEGAGNTVVATITLTAKPHGLALTPTGAQLYVSFDELDEIRPITTSNNTVGAPVTVGWSPMAMAMSPDGQKLYVTNFASDELSVVNTATNQVAATVAVGLAPYGVAVSADGSRVYVANFNNANLSVINAASNTVITHVPLAGNSSPCGVSLSPDGSTVYVSQENAGKVSLVNTANNTLGGTIDVGLMPVALGQFIVQRPPVPCTGPARSFTITVKPLPNMATPNNRAVCPDDDVVVPFTGSNGSITYSWSNNVAAVGLALNGTTTNVLAFTAANATASAQVATLLITPSLDGCTGATRSFNITVNPRPAKPVLTINGNLLTSPQATGNRWFVDNTQIPGVGTQNFMALQSGSYSLQVLMPGSPCPSLMSDPIAFVATAVSDVELERGIWMGPVPAADHLQVRTAGALGKISITIYNAAGMRLRAMQTNGQNTRIDLSGLPAGVYVAEIVRVNTGTKARRLFVKN